MFDAVSCPTANVCVAVGASNLPGGHMRALAAHWNGSVWSIDRLPIPAHEGDAQLTGVSCAAPTACMAVGNYFAGAGGTLAERWNGRRWSFQRTPTHFGYSIPGSFPSLLDTVSCPSTRDCIASGDDGNAIDPNTGVDYALNERWNGRSWLVLPNVVDGPISSVSCSSTTFCEAVGGGSQSGFGPFGIAEGWNGRAFQDSGAGNITDTLNGVSCTSRRFCLAVGGSISSVAARWDGSGWTAVRSPPGGDANLAVSCVTSTMCVAVGAGVASWGGVRWKPQRVPVPANGALNSVSCVSLSFCVAVGSDGRNPLAIQSVEGDADTP
jgi:hypothetical protein